MSENELKNKIEQIKNKISSLELLLEKKINKNDWKEYKNHINGIIKDIKREELSKIEKDIDLLKQHKDDSKERIAKLEQSLEELRNSIKSLEKRIDNVEENILKQVMQNGNDINTLSDDFKEFQSKVKVIEYRTEKQCEDINELERTNDDQNEKIEENKVDWIAILKWVVIFLLIIISALIGDSVSIADILGGIL